MPSLPQFSLASLAFSNPSPDSEHGKDDVPLVEKD